jgi:hypothetical protein
MSDTVSFSGDGQGFGNFTGAVEGKGLQDYFQNKLHLKQETSTL